MRRQPEGAHVGVPGFVGQQQGRGKVAPKPGLRVADPAPRLVDGSVSDPDSGLDPDSIRSEVPLSGSGF